MKLVVLGSVSGLHGVRGWVKVHSDTSPRSNILDYAVWQLLLEGRWKSFEVLDGRAQGKGVIALLSGIDDRDRAAGLVGTQIAVERDQLPDTEAGEYYWTDLEGLRVTNRDGVDMGIVQSLFATGSNDVMVVGGDRQRLIPFTEQVVLHVDLVDAGIMVDWDPDF